MVARAVHNSLAHVAESYRYELSKSFSVANTCRTVLSVVGLQIPSTMTTVTPSPTFMKRLAANGKCWPPMNLLADALTQYAKEKSTRDAAVSNLRTYLRARNDFSDVELLKLWKGLFYCMWMSDKPRNQQQLARDLADLIDVVSPGTVVGFADAFWKTMAREWNGIGRLRYVRYVCGGPRSQLISIEGWTSTCILFVNSFIPPCDTWLEPDGRTRSYLASSQKPSRVHR